MENGDAIVWKNNLQLLGKSTCKKQGLEPSDREIQKEGGKMKVKKKGRHEHKLYINLSDYMLVYDNLKVSKNLITVCKPFIIMGISPITYKRWLKVISNILMGNMVINDLYVLGV